MMRVVYNFSMMRVHKIQKSHATVASKFYFLTSTLKGIMYLFYVEVGAITDKSTACDNRHCLVVSGT